MFATKHARRKSAGAPACYTPRCIVVYMGRTNIEIDDRLVEQAMRMYRLSSKREAVDLALRRLVGDPMTREEALAMEGTGWGDELELDALRPTWIPPEP
jgi:Arc/MetJ family transcription regulator